MGAAQREAASFRNPKPGGEGEEADDAAGREQEDAAERQLLLSMGWDPADGEEDEEEGGLEEWEILAAQASISQHRAQEGRDPKGQRELAQRQFEAWKTEQGALKDNDSLEQLSGPPGLTRE